MIWTITEVDHNSLEKELNDYQELGYTIFTVNSYHDDRNRTYHTIVAYK